MVSNKFLGALAVKLGLHTHLRHFSNPLQAQIIHYAEDIQTAENESEGVVDYWVDTEDSPKVGWSGPRDCFFKTHRDLVLTGYGRGLPRSLFR